MNIIAYQLNCYCYCYCYYIWFGVKNGVRPAKLITPAISRGRFFFGNHSGELGLTQHRTNSVKALSGEIYTFMLLNKMFSNLDNDYTQSNTHKY